jgi:hypothetical protein
VGPARRCRRAVGTLGSDGARHDQRLSLDDAVAFRVEFAAVPPPAQRYWRGPVLAHFDGREWSALDRRPQRTPRAAGRTVSY